MNAKLDEEEEEETEENKTQTNETLVNALSLPSFASSAKVIATISSSNLDSSTSGVSNLGASTDVGAKSERTRTNTTTTSSSTSSSSNSSSSSSNNKLQETLLTHHQQQQAINKTRNSNASTKKTIRNLYFYF